MLLTLRPLLALRSLLALGIPALLGRRLLRLEATTGLLEPATRLLEPTPWLLTARLGLPALHLRLAATLLLEPTPWLFAARLRLPALHLRLAAALLLEPATLLLRGSARRRKCAATRLRVSLATVFLGQRAAAARLRIVRQRAAFAAAVGAAAGRSGPARGDHA